MKTVTMRCEVCKAKTVVEMDQAQYETFKEALDLGIQEQRWELYWALAEELVVRCYQHEGIVIV
jgi:hypothetical protein